MAAPQPPPTPTNFEHELPDDLMGSILVRVPCKDDRASMSLVCKAWHDKIARLIKSKAPTLPLPPPPPPPLPWLLLPSRFRNDEPAFRAACVLSGCCVHPHHNLLTTLPPGARFVGSYDGAWIFLYSDETRTHRLFNARTRRGRMLPEALAREREGHEIVSSMVILVATLSSSPEDSQCVGATIIARERDQAPDEVLQQPFFNRWIAFWRMGWEHAYQLVPGEDVAEDLALCLTEDVVYHEHDRAFHFLLTRGGAYQILVCTPDANPEDQLEINWAVRRFKPPGERIHCQNATVRARYLVMSRGELLMVVRFTTGANQQTSKFKVFRATERPQKPDADADSDFPVAAYPWEWSDLDTLDGRILFVGYGCSRSYQADEDKYPGFKPGIYFLDDGVFYEALMFGDANTRPYPCRDNGMWSEARIQSCFPPPNSSDYSPPVWLLP